MIVIGKKYGQLGNRLFLYARFIANAKVNNYAVYNPAFEEYAVFFEGTANEVLTRYRPPYSYRSIGNEVGVDSGIREQLRSSLSNNMLRFIEIFVSLDYRRSRFHRILWLDSKASFDMSDEGFGELVRSKQLIIIGGWGFENIEEVKQNRAEICKYFTPIKSLRENIKRTMNKARSSHDVVVGVHVRLGDYALYNGGKYYYDLKIYKEMMVKIVDMFPNSSVGFLICSNEQVDTSQWAGLDVAFGSGHLVEDMYSLADCDYLIGPPSTFSMWASFYGQKPLYSVEDPQDPFQIGDFKVVEGV